MRGSSNPGSTQQTCSGSRAVRAALRFLLSGLAVLLRRAQAQPRSHRPEGQAGVGGRPGAPRLSGTSLGPSCQVPTLAPNPLGTTQPHPPPGLTSQHSAHSLQENARAPQGALPGSGSLGCPLFVGTARPPPMSCHHASQPHRPLLPRNALCSPGFRPP